MVNPTSFVGSSRHGQCPDTSVSSTEGAYYTPVLPVYNPLSEVFGLAETRVNAGVQPVRIHSDRARIVYTLEWISNKTLGYFEKASRLRME